jgi:proteasome lid subunit RPN8/RPN11
MSMTTHKTTTTQGVPPAPPRHRAAVLRLPRALNRRLAKIVHAGYPEETCGVLLGDQSEDAVTVVALTQARNLNREHARDRYELDPKDFLAADETARERKLQIVGIWHSHPDHPARPSETDRARAWEGWSYVIISVTADGVQELRSWRLSDADFVEETIE